MSGTIQGAPTASMTVASGAAGVFPVSFGYYPREGSRAVSAQYSWAAQTGYVEDLSQLAAKGVETTIQGVFIDNSTVPYPVTLTVLGTEQICVIPPNAQGMFPLFFSGTPALQITTTAVNSGVTRLYLLNVPLGGAATWSATGAQQLGPQGVNGGPIVPSPAYGNQYSAIQIAAVSALTTPAEGTVNGYPSSLIVDPYGSLFVDTECNAPVYSGVVFVNPTTSGADAVTLSGSASKTIRVHQIIVSLSGSSAPENTSIAVFKRSTANSGGTFVPITPLPHDKNSSAASAVIGGYSVSPTTPGTFVGILEEVYLAASTLNIAPVVFTYGQTDQSVILRGTGDLLTVSVNPLPASPAMLVKIKWSEI